MHLGQSAGKIPLFANLFEIPSSLSFSSSKLSIYLTLICYTKVDLPPFKSNRENETDLPQNCPVNLPSGELRKKDADPPSHL